MFLVFVLFLVLCCVVLGVCDVLGVVLFLLLCPDRPCYWLDLNLPEDDELWMLV